MSEANWAANQIIREKLAPLSASEAERRVRLMTFSGAVAEKLGMNQAQIREAIDLASKAESGESEIGKIVSLVMEYDHLAFGLEDKPGKGQDEARKQLEADQTNEPAILKAFLAIERLIQPVSH